jgi:SAM-dependent methyltransferase
LPRQPPNPSNESFSTMNEISSNTMSDRRRLFGGERDNPSAMLNMILGHVVAQVVHCAALFSLADHLAEGPTAAETVAHAEGLNSAATFRLMRACTAFGLMTYDRETGFSGTPLLATLRRDDQRHLRAGAIALTSHGHWAPWGELAEAIRTGEPRAEATLGASIFDYFASPAGAAEWDAFSEFLAGISAAVSAEAARLIDTRQVSLAVDVGGASGSLVHALMAANPALRGAVLDLPHVALDAARAAAALGLGDRFSFVAGDFRNAVPTADLYLLKHVLHDWADATCGSILQNCRRALRPGGRVIVIELLADDVEPTSLLAQFDLTMMVACGSRERTLDEYKGLLVEAGLRFVGATATATPLFLIEAVAD